MRPWFANAPPATTDQDTRLDVLVAPHRRQLDARSGHDLDFKWFHRRLANSESQRSGVGSTGRPPPEHPIIPLALVHILSPPLPRWVQRTLRRPPFPAHFTASEYGVGLRSLSQSQKDRTLKSLSSAKKLAREAILLGQVRCFSGSMPNCHR